MYISIYITACKCPKLISLPTYLIFPRKRVKTCFVGTISGEDPMWRPAQQLIRARGNLCCLPFAETPQKVHVAGMSCCSIVHVPVPVFRDAAVDRWRRGFPHVEPEEDWRFRHLQKKWPLRCGRTHQVILRPQVLHVICLRIKPESFRNWMPTSMSMNKYIRNSLFTAPSSPSIARP
jgi:hypothetical protein